MYAKKVVSLVSSGENLILPLLAPLQKYCWPTPGKSTIGPSLEKNPSGAHVQEYILIYRKAEGVHGKKKFGNPCSRASFCDFRPSRVSLRYLFSVCNSLFVCLMLLISFFNSSCFSFRNSWFFLTSWISFTSIESLSAVFLWKRLIVSVSFSSLSDRLAIVGFLPPSVIFRFNNNITRLQYLANITINEYHKSLILWWTGSGACPEKGVCPEFFRPGGSRPPPRTLLVGLVGKV